MVSAMAEYPEPGSVPGSVPGDAAPPAGQDDEQQRERHHEVAEYALLGLLREGPCHGYRLAAAFAPNGRLAPILRLKMSQMYAYLHKLERVGWLTAEEVMREDVGRPRRVFALTDAGAHAFDAWLAQPVAATRDIRLDFLVKLAFAIERDHAAAARLVEAQRAIVDERLQRLRHEAARITAPSGAPDLQRLALSHRIHQSEATVAWLDDVRATIQPD